MCKSPQLQCVLLADDGRFPNHPRFPLLLYTGAFRFTGGDGANEVERRFTGNGWPAAWRNGVYPFHHYHSECHEALGVYRGSATVQFGGPGGPEILLQAGDVAVLPAGTVHKRIDAGHDFAVVGAYPPGQRPDMCYGKPGERPAADAAIAAVPVPATDPVLGDQGGVVREWRTRNQESTTNQPTASPKNLNGAGDMNEIIVEHAPSDKRLAELGVNDWPVWTKEPSEFPWHYSDRERCYILEGDIVVTPDGGEPVEIQKGDFVTFPEGMSCTWQVRRAVRKHYQFG